MEKQAVKRPWRDFRERKNPWMNASRLEHLRALTQIVFPENNHESAQSGFSSSSDKDNLLRNKQASGHPKDLIDVQSLENMTKES